MYTLLRQLACPSLLLLACLAGSLTANEADANNEAVNRLVKKYPRHADVVTHVCKTYYLNAFRLESQYGINGILFLDKLGVDALLLEKQHPILVKEILRLFGGDGIDSIFGCWRELITLEGVRSPQIQQWLSVLARLDRWQSNVAKKHPKAIPAIAVAPDLVCRYLEDKPRTAAEPYFYLDYSREPIKQVTRLTEALLEHGLLAGDFTEEAGFPGTLLYLAHSELLDQITPHLGVRPAFAVVQGCSEDLASLRRTYSIDKIAASVIPYSKDSRVLESACASSYGLRLLVEFGDKGANCLRAIGSVGADVLYEEYNRPRLKANVVNVLTHGKLAAVVVLRTYADSDRFRAILETSYALQAVLQISRGDQLARWNSQISNLPREEQRKLSTKLLKFVTTFTGTGETEIDLIYERGPSYLNDTLSPEELLPGYDLVKIIRLLATGKVPTTGEFAWATIDVVFLAWDVVDILGAIPSGGLTLGDLAAHEAIRVQVKVMAKQGTKVTTKKAVREITEQVSEMILKSGKKNIDDIAEEAVRIAAREFGQKLSEEALQQQSQQIALQLPMLAFRLALRNFVAKPFRRKSASDLMEFSMDNMSWSEMKTLLRPSSEFIGISLLRDGPRKIGNKLISWLDLVPKGAIVRRVKAELIQNTAGYFCLSHMDDVLSFLLANEE